MDAFENLKKRAEELRAELNRHARLYYEDDAPEIYRLVCELEGQQFVYDAFFRSFASQLSDTAVHCLVLEVDGRVVIDDKIKAALDAYYEQYGAKE